MINATVIITTYFGGIYMKKALTTAGVALALGLFAGVATTAHAADNLENKTDSNANFEVTISDDKAGLQLTSVPSFNFGTIGQEALISNSQSLNGSASGDLEVTDYSGNDAGWTLQGQLGEFHNADSSDKFSADSMTLNGKDAAVTADDITDPALASANLQQNGTALTAAKGTGAGKTTATFGTTTKDAVSDTTKAATLVLPKHTTVKAGTYSTTIDWLLGAGQTSDDVPAADDTSNS
ncbi:hypothetical protein LB003_07135 [Loigolactobacillus bifermentans]|nr:hypothetical protein LB003_07135 [Loigolactobacillus bifermentans]